MNVGAAEAAPANAGSQALSLPHTLQRAQRRKQVRGKRRRTCARKPPHPELMCSLQYSRRYALGVMPRRWRNTRRK